MNENPDIPDPSDPSQPDLAPPAPSPAPAPVETGSGGGATPPEGPKPTTFERVGERVADFFGVSYKRGPGRPRKDGQPKGNDRPAPPEMVSAATPVVDSMDSPYGSDDGFAAEVAATAIESLFLAWDRLLSLKATRLFGNETGTKIVEENSITKREVENYRKFMGMIAKRYPQHKATMEMAAGTVLCGVVPGRYALLARELAQEEAKRRGPKIAPAAQP